MRIIMGKTEAKYIQIFNWIKEKIANKELQPGDKLESEMELSRRFKVSRQTVRHALNVLAKEGVIQGRQGSGNYIAKNEVEAIEMKHNTIVLLSTYINTGRFVSILRGIEEVIKSDEWTIRIMVSHNELIQERKLLNTILGDCTIAGVLAEPVLAGIYNPNYEMYKEIYKKQIPLIFWGNYYFSNDVIPCVSVNDKKVGYLGAHRLLDLGYEKIACVFRTDNTREKMWAYGYAEALLERGINVCEDSFICRSIKETSNDYWINTYPACICSLDFFKKIEDEQLLGENAKKLIYCVVNGWNITVGTRDEIILLPSENYEVEIGRIMAKNILGLVKGDALIAASNLEPIIV